MPSAAVLGQIADALPWPLLLLRRDAVLLHANLAGRQLLHRGQTLRMDGQQRVQSPLDAQQTALADALKAGRPALLQWPPKSASSPGHPGCFVVLKPLAARGGDSPGDGDAAVLVMLSSPASPHRDLQAFAAMHRLSPAEVRVLEQLSLGHSTAGIAAALGTQPATVRSQLTSLRRKSGHASLVLLLRALATLPPRSPVHLVQPSRDAHGE